MTAIFGVLAVAVLVAVLWLAAKLGRQSAVSEAARDTLRRVQEIQEIENEVQALDRDTLKSRASRWVRATGK